MNQPIRLQAGEVNSTTNLFSGFKHIQYENLHDLVILGRIPLDAETGDMRNVHKGDNEMHT